ncbi:MAG: cytidine deaminase [Bacteroidales bacterium]|nr:cytidine deaminase [Bacteroidales bacterium]
MRKDQFVCPYIVCDDPKELDPKDAELLCQAHEAAKNAYAPYSKFNVGAAVRLANGVVVLGNNVENAAYPSGLCAERVAMFAAMAQYPGVAFEALAVTAYSASKHIDEPVAPCGACRQVMVEAEHVSKRPLRVLCQGEIGPIMVFDGVESLMPFVFLEKFL